MANELKSDDKDVLLPLDKVNLNIYRMVLMMLIRNESPKLFENSEALKEENESDTEKKSEHKILKPDEYPDWHNHFCDDNDMT